MKNEMKSVGPYSISRWAGDLLFVSGQLPINQETGELEQGLIAQCERSLANMELALENENLTLDDIVKVTVLMNNLEDFDEINNLFEERFNQPYPSRSTFEVSRLPKDALIEIEAIAFKK